MQSLEYCAVYQQKTCLRFLTLYFKYKTHVPLNKGARPPSVLRFIDFCFSPNATKHYIFFSLKNKGGRTQWLLTIRGDGLVCSKGQLGSITGDFF